MNLPKKPKQNQLACVAARERFDMKGSQSSIHLSSSSVMFAASALTLLALAAPSARAEAKDNRAPTVPDAIKVPSGNRVQFLVYAAGVQIYTWSGSAWVFKAPEAVLFDADENIVGIHYAGPTWESESGSKVVGARVDGVTVDSSAIPWLLLRAVSAEGPGIFRRTTYIQRINTVGGLAPATPGSVIGEEARVDYTAEYFFYRAK